jgi:NADH-quinone oxidoreductase subunit N
MSVTFLGDFAPLAVDLVLAIGAFTVLLADIALPAGDKRVLAWGTLAALLVALGATFGLDVSGEAWGGAYVGDELALFFKRIFLIGGALTVLGSQLYAAEHYERRQGEYYELLLFSVLGMSLLGGVRDIVLLVVCFELMGIPLYALAAWGRRNKKGVEGALKLYLVGAVSSACILYGVSFLFGLSGTTELAGIAAYVSNHATSPIVVVGASVAVAGMGFKIGVFPFHMWVPDTYEGSATPFVAFLSVAPKAAGLVAMVQILYAGDRSLLAGVLTVILVLATLTIVMGNLLAINQSNIKRLLGYSGVAHMGFLLMALATGEPLGLSMMLFYLLGYLFTNVGAFLVIHAVQRAGGDDTVASFSGLITRSGWLSWALLAFLLSLAGIPFFVGFWAKLYVFLAAWQAGFGWLVLIAAVLSVVALFYYLRIVRAVFMNPAPDGAEPIAVDLPTNIGIGVCVVMVVLMGLWPRPFVEASQAAATDFMGGVDVVSVVDSNSRR